MRTKSSGHIHRAATQQKPERGRSRGVLEVCTGQSSNDPPRLNPLKDPPERAMNIV